MSGHLIKGRGSAMVTTTNPVVNELLGLLAKLQADYGEAQERLEKELGVVREKIKAVETTLELYSRDRDIPGPRPTTVGPEDIKGLSHNEALERIAELSGGLLRIQEAKRLFIAAKITVGNPKYVGPHLYTLVKDNEKFEWDSPGVFRLKSKLSVRQPELIAVNG